MDVKRIIRVVLFWVLAVIWGFISYTMLSFVGWHWEHNNISVLAWPFAFMLSYFLGLLMYWPYINWVKIVQFFKDKR